MLGTLDVELEQVDPTVSELAHHLREAADLRLEVVLRPLEVHDRVRDVRRVAGGEEPQCRVFRPEAGGEEMKTGFVRGDGFNVGDGARRRIEREHFAPEPLDEREVEADVLADATAIAGPR